MEMVNFRLFIYVASVSDYKKSSFVTMNATLNISDVNLQNNAVCNVSKILGIVNNNRVCKMFLQECFN